MIEEKKRLHAFVHGRVQGVGFRWFVMESTRDTNVTGWVRNRYDMTVEVTAEGTQEELDKLLQSLHKGPPSSNVRKVDARWMTGTEEFDGFTVKRDA